MLPSTHRQEAHHRHRALAVFALMVVRVLCLPGYSQNKNVFHKKFAAIEKYCGKSVEFVIIDPPIELKPSDVAGAAPAFDSIANFDEPELTPRAWWLSNETRTVYFRAEESIKYIWDILAAQSVPFDGVLGFSQGAAMAAMTVALLERPHHFDYLSTDGKPPHPPLRFGIYVSGFKPIDSKVTSIFNDDKLKTPSVQILGRNDVIVGIKRSQTLIDACEHPRVMWHDGGHFIPAKLSWRQFFKNYFLSWDPSSKVLPEDVPSPVVSATDTLSQLGTPTATRPNTPPPQASSGLLDSRPD
ncbi:serine hydrolase-domain-containing protein [Cantharellus anzutake]|uniref:serine hydrolase-domain-containing protein n=1 Tax=Cantharellus anzutake TaxID=1750568 RepID=UPI00190376DB|nr:serine hydrolase-domain-containing protein [Cantharellus anzutake]KAF8331367.1 serine hydrolase-domain-containing protein [Cantharellus anzutake]